mgnify:CR=1 FL=1
MVISDRAQKDSLAILTTVVDRSGCEALPPHRRPLCKSVHVPERRGRARFSLRLPRMESGPCLRPCRPTPGSGVAQRRL